MVARNIFGEGGVFSVDPSEKVVLGTFAVLTARTIAEGHGSSDLVFESVMNRDRLHGSH